MNRILKAKAAKLSHPHQRARRTEGFRPRRGAGYVGPKACEIRRSKKTSVIGRFSHCTVHPEIMKSRIIMNASPAGDPDPRRDVTIWSRMTAKASSRLPPDCDASGTASRADVTAGRRAQVKAPGQRIREPALDTSPPANGSAAVEAQDEARTLNHDYIGTEHILLGLIREGDGGGRAGAGEAGRRPEPGAPASHPAAARLPGTDMIGRGSRPGKRRRAPGCPIVALAQIDSLDDSRALLAWA